MKFTSDVTRDGKYMRFRFQFPPINGRSENSVTPKGIESGTVSVAREAADSAEGILFREAVARVTKFRRRVKAWTFDPQPPGEEGLIVAAELSFANRFRVASINKKNRAALVKFWSGEAMARRAAIMQPTPQMGLFALREQLEKYGVKKPDEETRRLMRALERACEVVEADDTVVPLKTDGTLDVQESIH